MRPSGGLERCTGAALAEAHQLIKSARVKTDRIVFAPFGLCRPGKHRSRTGLDVGCDPGRVLQFDHVRTGGYRTCPIKFAVTSSASASRVAGM
jgi:hypothetical protein